MKPKHTIEIKDRQLAIYNNCGWEARIYDNIIIIDQDVIKWQGNTGGLASQRHRLEGKIVSDINALLAETAEIEEDLDYYDDVIAEKIDDYLADGIY